MRIAVPGRRLLGCSAAPRLCRVGRRFGSLLGLAQGSEPGSLFALRDQAGLVVRHGFGGFAGLDFLFSELEFRPFPGLFRGRGQCCFPIYSEKTLLD